MDDNIIINNICIKSYISVKKISKSKYVRAAITAIVTAMLFSLVSNLFYTEISDFINTTFWSQVRTEYFDDDNIVQGSRLD